MQKKVEILTARLHTIASQRAKQGDPERALQAIALCATLNYESNRSYVDECLEELIQEISLSLYKPTLTKGDMDRNTVLFYDGFGVDARGLALIYLKALCSLGFHVVYVTCAEAAGRQPQLEKETGPYSMVWHYLPHHASMLTRVQTLTELFETYRPAHVFLYAAPSDVSAVLTFRRFEGIVTRYQINLTDHAFWLGKYALDYCVEFREYGASISCLRRGIPPEKLAMLPYYPYIDETEPFGGYPFSFDEERQKLVFSGGSLYKTLGAGNLYYQMVSSILETDETVVFWYAGSGDSTELEKLIHRYPGRVFHTAERKDLFQILKRCTFYLSTYPLAGGLMYQYAAVAGKLPLTLDYEENEAIWGMLLQEKSLGIHFVHLEDLLSEAARILSDASYRAGREKDIAKAVLSPEEFEFELKRLLDTGKTMHPVKIHEIDDRAFLKTYADRITYRYLCMSVAKPRMPWLIRYFPKEYLLGTIWKLPAWINVLWGRRKGMHHGKNKS